LARQILNLGIILPLLLAVGSSSPSTLFLSGRPMGNINSLQLLQISAFVSMFIALGLIIRAWRRK